MYRNITDIVRCATFKTGVSAVKAVSFISDFLVIISVGVYVVI